jgi:hypothetical protein
MYGIGGMDRPLPRQTTEAIVLHAERFRRAADALQTWSTQAKRAVEYFEGKQWSSTDLQKLRREKRPALTINKIRPLVNLVIGYHLNNRTEDRVLPGHDASGSSETALSLTHVFKQIDEICQMPWIDAEVFLDGITTGRAYYDSRLDFENNDFGDVKITASDPFATYLDPDGDRYDLNETCSFVATSRMVSVDEVEHHYGRLAADWVRPLTRGAVFNAFPTGLYDGAEEVTPWRRFGGEEEVPQQWATFGQQFYDWIDRARKSVRLVDMQHYVRCKRWFFVDLDTGDRRPVPDHWTRDKVEKTVFWSQQQGYPVIVQQRATRRLRWTHMVGDVIVYDEWSPYSSFTLTPFFPYFRRGVTQGLVEHLLDAQDEVNKRRSARLNIIGRSSSGGWQFPKGSLDAQQKANLEMYGSTPGFHMEYDTKDGKLGAPQQIQPGTTPVAMAQLENEASDDLKEIAGINDSALGQIDQASLSGRAIEARQRQTIVGLEGFMANYHRSKELLGRKKLELVQEHYTEERIIRITGPGNNPIQMTINQRTAAGIVNNVCLGKYRVVIDETSLSKSFLEGQFNELREMKEIGMPIPDEFIVDASSVGRKDEMKAALAAARQAEMAAAAAGAAPAGGPARGPGPGGSLVGSDGGSLPAGPEPGAPIPLPPG